MKDTLKRYAQNFLGQITNRKFLIIESDDWGSILMPNRQTYNLLEKRGLRPDKNPYFRYDALASEEDLAALFDTLRQIKDHRGNSVIITANSVVANPDFKKIKEDNFENYFWEPFTDTLQRYPKHSKSFELWKQGIKNNVFRPQYHGREHLNVYQWMMGLKSKEENLLKAFELEMVNIKAVKDTKEFSYMSGLGYYSKKEKESKSKILQEGLELFNDILGYRSKSFIANCYVWDDAAENVLSKNGVKYMQGINSQVKPILKKDGNVHRVIKTHYFGQKNKYGQRYLIRNVFFEPSLDPNKDWFSDCLKRIDIAFKCKKPAIICSHRLNYIGFIDEQNRTQNLMLLSAILKEVVKRWPDVEFISTDQLDDIF